MSSTRTLVISLFPLLVSAAAAQAPPAQDRAAALKESLLKNQAALRQYTWIETTQVSLKGEVKKQEEKQCSYGADGKVQKTPAAGAPSQAPQPQQGGGRRRGGRVKEAIVENKVEGMKEYMERVVALVHEYVPPDPQKIQAAQSAGNVSTEPSPGGPIVLTVKSYVKPGDSLAIGFDTAARKLSSYQVSSYVEKPKDDEVTLAVTFAVLEDGTSYPQRVVLDAKAKNIIVTVTNSGYRKSGA
jgi:hypothetical protein